MIEKITAFKNPATGSVFTDEFEAWRDVLRSMFQEITGNDALSKDLATQLTNGKFQDFMHIVRNIERVKNEI